MRGAHPYPDIGRFEVDVPKSLLDFLLREGYAAAPGYSFTTLLPSPGRAFHGREHFILKT